jgi:hypothetical protein
MPSDDLLLGAVVGAVAAGIVGFVFGRLRLAQKSIGGFFEPQRVSLETDKSPAQVLFGCVSSAVTLLIVLVIVAFVALYLLGYLE